METSRFDAVTFDKLVITWNGTCVQTLFPPSAALGPVYMYQTLKEGIVICWQPNSTDPANTWWQSLKLRQAPVINGDIVLMRFGSALTLPDLKRVGSKVFSIKFHAHFLDFQVV